MIQNATEVRLIIHLLKYLKNKYLEQAYFLHYIARACARKICCSWFHCSGMEHKKTKLILRTGSWVLIFHFRFKTSEKSLYEAVRFINFCRQSLPRRRSVCAIFFDIVLSETCETRLELLIFLNFWDKNAEKFSIPSPEGNNAVRIMTIHKSKGLEFPSDHVCGRRL
jgi:hypothetical protein